MRWFPRFAEIRSLFAAFVDEGMHNTERPWLKPHPDRTKQYMRDAAKDFMERQAEKLGSG